MWHSALEYQWNALLMPMWEGRVLCIYVHYIKSRMWAAGQEKNIFSFKTCNCVCRFRNCPLSDVHAQVAWGNTFLLNNIAQLLKFIKILAVSGIPNILPGSISNKYFFAFAPVLSDLSVRKTTLHFAINLCSYWPLSFPIFLCDKGRKSEFSCGISVVWKTYFSDIIDEWCL